LPKNLAIGGISKCCKAALTNHLDCGGGDHEGSSVDCRRCGNRLHVKGEVWRWDSIYELDSVIEKRKAENNGKHHVCSENNDSGREADNGSL